MTEIQKRLFELQDVKYRDFQSALIPDVKKESFIGVRTPILRSLAKEIRLCGESEEFLNSLPHDFFDENQLHAFIISDERDFDACIRLVNDFLPFVDNWATCDQMSPKCFYKSPEKLLPQIEKWLSSDHCYTVRFGILCLMRYFLDERFDLSLAEKAARTDTSEYYVRMAVAWYFATALYKQYDAILPFISENRLDVKVHNKAIQKAIESNRISLEQKTALKLLKRKE